MTGRLEPTTELDSDTFKASLVAPEVDGSGYARTGWGYGWLDQPVSRMGWIISGLILLNGCLWGLVVT